MLSARKHEFSRDRSTIIIYDTIAFFGPVSQLRHNVLCLIYFSFSRAHVIGQYSVCSIVSPREPRKKKQTFSSVLFYTCSPFLAVGSTSPFIYSLSLPPPPHCYIPLSIDINHCRFNRIYYGLTKRKRC